MLAGSLNAAVAFAICLPFIVIGGQYWIRTNEPCFAQLLP